MLTSRFKVVPARERRTNNRLRALIDEFKAEGWANRHDLERMAARLEQLQVEVDTLKKLRPRS
jgi:hypothetical protein